MYNAQDTIERCVESFLCQKYPNFELILVDDASGDNTYDMCVKLKNQYEQIQLYQSAQKGVSAARNFGLKQASGDIICFCDSDDTTVPKSLYILSELFEKYKDVDMIVSGYNRIFQNEKGGKVKEIYDSKKKIWSAEQLENHILYDNKIMGSVCNKFFRRNLLQNISFDTNLFLCEDMHFLFRVLSKHKETKILRLNCALYNYHHNTDSVTNSVKKIFNRNGRIEYVISMEAIIRDCELRKYTYGLARRAMLVVASDILIYHDVTKKQKKEILAVIKRNLIYFICFPSITPKANILRIIKFFVRGIWK